VRNKRKKERTLAKIEITGAGKIRKIENVKKCEKKGSTFEA